MDGLLDTAIYVTLYSIIDSFLIVTYSKVT
jgi:hypothetical protein